MGALLMGRLDWICVVNAEAEWLTVAANISAADKAYDR